MLSLVSSEIAAIRRVLDYLHEEVEDYACNPYDDHIALDMQRLENALGRLETVY